LLRERGKLDVKNKTLDCFIVYIGHLSGYVWSIIEKLRSKEYLVKFDYKPSGLSKQLKDASSQNVKYCIIIGNDEVQKNKITVKNMSNSEQSTIPIKDFLENPEDFIVR
jgi:histidyl-tRNA synthetase